MIHHISIPAKDTFNVANVLSEIFDGTVTDFRPTENAYMVWFGDEFGSAVEVYPEDVQLIPGDEEQPCQFDKGNELQYTAVHAAMSISKSREEIYKIAKKENWHAAEFVRGSFAVIEFWIENKLMLELLTSDMVEEYLTLSAKYRN